MNNKPEKPTPEAKALSLFFMAHKATNPVYKEKAKRIKRLYGLVLNDEFSRSDYDAEVQSMLTACGGYEEVLWKTVKFYIDKTGEWNLKGDDKYCLDAQEIADKLLKK